MECRGLNAWRWVLLLATVTAARFIKDGKNESLSTQGTCYYNGTWFEDKEELPTRGLCLVCHCFLGFTEPNAFTCSVIDCPWDDYHRRFPGCTPIYADRDCCPIGWECDYGTQNPGSQQVKSPGCDCEWRYLKHYEAKGCRPVYEEKKRSEGEDSLCTCPWRFDCSQADELHADERACIYKKHVYPIGSKITTNNPCETCSCVRDYFTQAATISCSNTECPTVYSQTPLPEGCHYVYKENMCCPTSVECPTAQKDNVYKVPICEYKGKMYYEGEQIYPDEDPCLICLCNQNWTGINSTSCRQHDCMLERDSRKLKQGCIPIYHEKTCCPIDYHCADEDFDFKGNKGPSFKSEDDEDEMCYFESRYYPVGHVLDIKHPTNCVTCTCKTPPDFTCIHSSCPPPPNNDYNNCKAVYKPHSCCPDYTCEEKVGRACPDPICKGTNCWLVKQEDGCQVCRCKSRCVPCPPMCQPENPENECSGCICQINSTALLESEKKDEALENKQESSLKHLVQECKSMNCQSDERCMLTETKCEEEPCLPVPKCEKVSFGCGQKSCPEGCEEIGSYESSCPLCYCKQQIKKSQYKLTCRVQSCEENCILIGRDEEGCPVCKCPQGNLEERACAPSPCRGYNCTMAVNALGCAECRCQLSCKPKECPVGCDMDLDVPANSGLECGCQCKNSTTAMEHILSKSVPDTCPPVSCQGLNCTYGEDKAGCPICFCKAPCPEPTCQEGCRVEKDVKEPGRCPGCACKLSRSARDNTVKECPPPTCLGYNCSVVTADDGCQKCICESPCEKEPKCPSHCKIETNAPEGRCRGCVCSVGEQADSEDKPHEVNESISEGTEPEPEKREDLEADFIPLPGEEIVPEVEKIYFVHGDGDKEKYAGLPGYHYSGGHAFPVFGEHLESGLYNTDDHISEDVEGGQPDEAREELHGEESHPAGDYEHDEDGYVPDYAEEKTIEDDEDEKCVQKNCPEGQKCVIRRLQCIRTPCPTIPVCIDVEPRCPIPMCAIGCMVMKWDDEVCPSCFCGIIRGAEGRVCPRTRCVGRRCYNVIGDDGCPQCKCDSICIAPTCTEGCSVDKDPPQGKCPTCVCPSKSTVEPSIIRGTSPAINATEPGTDYDNVEDLNQGPEDYETSDENHSEHTDEYMSDDGTTMITEESLSSDEVPTGVDLPKTEGSTEDNLKLSFEHLQTDLYESLAAIEEQVKMSDPTTITINLPETSDYSDIIETSSGILDELTESETDSSLSENTPVVSGEQIIDFKITTTRVPSSSRRPPKPYKRKSTIAPTAQSTTISIDLPSEESPTTPKPCMQKPNISNAEVEESPVVNAFDDAKPIETKTTIKPSTVTQKQTRPTQVTSTKKPQRKPTPIRRKNTPRPSTRKPIYSIETTPSDLPKEKVTASSITSESTEINRPAMLGGRPSNNQHLKQKPALKPHFTSENSEDPNVKDPESNREESEGSMKPILQNLQQLMSNLQNVLSNHQRPVQPTEYAPQVPQKKEPTDPAKITNLSNTTKAETSNTSESEILQPLDSMSANISIQNEEKDTLDLKTATEGEIPKDDSKSKPNSESSPEKQNETSENTKNKPDLLNNPLALHGALLQHLISNPSIQNILASHHLLSNPAFVSPLLQQGVNPQYHIYPQYAYQSNPGTMQLLHPSQIPNIPYQTSYYPQTQGQGFLSNLPLQHDQFSQISPQFQQQQFLSTNLPMPQSLQQQLQAGTQKIGFLTQFNNHNINTVRPQFVSGAAVAQSPETSHTNNVLDTKYPNPQEINKSTSAPDEVHITAQAVEIQTMPPFPEKDNTSNNSSTESVLSSEETTQTSSETDQTVIQQFNHHAPPSKQQSETPVSVSSVQTSGQSQSEIISSSNDGIEEIPINHQNDHSQSGVTSLSHDESAIIEKKPDLSETQMPHLQDLERLNYQSQQQQVLIQQLQAQQSHHQNQLQQIQSNQEQYFYDKNKDKPLESATQILNDQAQLEISSGNVPQAVNVPIQQNEDRNVHVTSHFRPENIQNQQVHSQTQFQDPHFVNENSSVNQEIDNSQQNQQIIQSFQNNVQVQNTFQQNEMQNKPYLLQEQTQYLNQNINKVPTSQQAAQSSFVKDDLVAQQHQIQQQYQAPHVVLLKPDSSDPQVGENVQSQYYLPNHSQNIPSQDSQGVLPLDLAQVRKQIPTQSEHPQTISNHNIPFNKQESSQQLLHSEQPQITQVLQHQKNFSDASLQQDAYNSYAIVNNQNQVSIHQQESNFQNKPLYDQQQSQYTTYTQDRPFNQQQFINLQDKYVLDGVIGSQYGPSVQGPHYASQNNHQPQEILPSYIQPASQNLPYSQSVQHTENVQRNPTPAIQQQNQQLPHENQYTSQSFQQQAPQEQYHTFWTYRPSEANNQIKPSSPSYQHPDASAGQTPVQQVPNQVLSLQVQNQVLQQTQQNYINPTQQFPHVVQGTLQQNQPQNIAAGQQNFVQNQIPTHQYQAYQNRPEYQQQSYQHNAESQNLQPSIQKPVLSPQQPLNSLNTGSPIQQHASVNDQFHNYQQQLQHQQTYMFQNKPRPQQHVMQQESPFLQQNMPQKEVVPSVVQPNIPILQEQGSYQQQVPSVQQQNIQQAYFISSDVPYSPEQQQVHQQTYTPPSEPVQQHPNYGYQQQLPTSSENVLQKLPNAPQVLSIHSASVPQQQNTYQNTFSYQSSQEQISPQVGVTSEQLSSQHPSQHIQFVQQQVRPQVQPEYQQFQQEHEIKPLNDQHISDYSHQSGVAGQQILNANERPQQQVQTEFSSFNPAVLQQNYEQQTSFKPSEDIQEELQLSDEDGFKNSQQQEEIVDTKPYEQQLQHSEIGSNQDFQQNSDEDRYLALKPIAQIITASSQYSKDEDIRHKDELSDNASSKAPTDQSEGENQSTPKDHSFDQFLVQESVPPFEETTPKVHYGVKGRPGSVVRPHFHPVSSKSTTSTSTTTTTTESTHDLFPAPSRPLNQKPDDQQEEDYAHQQFVEEDIPQELSPYDDDYDFDENTLPTTTTLTTQPPQAITTTKLFAPLHLSTAHPTTVKPPTSDETSQQHEIIESFDNHQPDFGKKPIDIQESIEYDTTTPKKHLFAQPSTLKDPNTFASFPTASPTADTYGTAQHTSKSPISSFSSYHCPTPHCNGYNCSLLRGADGCQKCVCDSPCAPCPQYCVKTKVLSEGRCPICDCTVAHASGQQVPVRQCPNVDCVKPNCRKVKDNDGCFTCLCDPKCAEPKCDPGCEVLRDVPPGQCPGCVCRVTVVQAVVNKPKQCPVISCTGQNCRETKGPDGCSKCICDVSCPPPKCDPGCEVQTDVAQGQCPTCVCPTFHEEDDDEDDDLYCPNLFCADYGCREIPGPAGCPICMCDPVCKTPVCDPGCEVVTNKYLGRCPVCICSAPLGQASSTSSSISSPSNISYQAVESIKQPPSEVAQYPFSVAPVAMDDQEAFTESTLHTTVTVHLSPTEQEEEEEEYEDETTEPTTTTTEVPVTTCPAPVCSGLRCSFEVGDDGCEVCKCRYKCPKPKCVGNCYPETNYPSHRCPGCVCPQKRPSKP